MVLRKSSLEADPVPAPLVQTVNNPPYPTTPADEFPPNPYASSSNEVHFSKSNTSPAVLRKPVAETQKQVSHVEDDSDWSDNEWDHSDEEVRKDIPNPLKIGGGKPIPVSNNHQLPNVLRAGPPGGVQEKKSMDAVLPEYTGGTSSSWGAGSAASGGTAPLQTNNPYLKAQNTGQSHFGAESSQQVWGDTVADSQGNREPVELPSMHTPDTPTNRMANLALGTELPPMPQRQAPEQPPLISVESATPETPHPRHDSTASEGYNPGMDISSLDAFARSYGLPEDSRQTNAQRTWKEQQDWDRNERERKQHEAAAAQESAKRAEQERRHEEDYYRLENAPVPVTYGTTVNEQDFTPSLPLRSHEGDRPPPMPPRPLETGVTGSSLRGPDSPNTVQKRQKAENYQIKQIRWYDINKKGIRMSPIMTQNMNGPCPLLALVNALVLSTPAGLDTALEETLRTREQVSLGLLLDAVVEELLSGRRGDADQGLNDPSKLYAFLLALHTGMNVNPLFNESTEGPQTHQQPGTFEDTQDMKFYRTFGIPLMHGWLPEFGSEIYRAFGRIATSYETSQFVQFQEEELDLKLQRGEALSAEEQQTFTDIHAIKDFLSAWPTQLTAYGLKTIRETLRPGEVAILFRNDHFSTLYKDPRTDNLVTLVTDQGYSSHDEIVWESLVDVNGQGSELFSGDFLPVGNHSSLTRPQTETAAQNLPDDNEGWTTVQSRRNAQQTQTATPEVSQNGSPLPDEASRTEQEDHDLALALQLQEEEEDRHRRTQEERRRQDQLSQDAIAARAQSHSGNARTSGSGDNPPVMPPRRNHAQTQRYSEGPAPPPSYAEASSRPAYNPPQGQPVNAGGRYGPQGSAYQQVSHGSSMGPSLHGVQPGRPGGRQSAGAVGANGNQKEDKCVVM